LQQQYLRAQVQGDEHIGLYYLGVDNLEEVYENQGQTGLVQLHEQFYQRLVNLLGADEQWSDMAQAKVIINALRDINCGVCLTQAGISAHSDQIIQQHKFDFIKLLPRLTTQLNGERLVDVQRIAELAKNSGAQIITTQVEDAKNLTRLWLQGVRLFQGFFIQVPEQKMVAEAQLEFYEAGQKNF
jgi:EAL domain-containing protein (putative c-di-GMP-specific phosphodiesterase class I)